jgi:hypothetical protein
MLGRLYRVAIPQVRGSGRYAEGDVPMSILYSTEIRWIIAGIAPASIKRWYEGDAWCNREKVRVDYYLTFPGDAFVGVKLRKYEDGADIEQGRCTLSGIALAAVATDAS